MHFISCPLAFEWQEVKGDNLAPILDRSDQEATAILLATHALDKGISDRIVCRNNC